MTWFLNEKNGKKKEEKRMTYRLKEKLEREAMYGLYVDFDLKKQTPQKAYEIFEDIQNTDWIFYINQVLFGEEE